MQLKVRARAMRLGVSFVYVRWCPFIRQPREAETRREQSRDLVLTGLSEVGMGEWMSNNVTLERTWEKSSKLKILKWMIFSLGLQS